MVAVNGTENKIHNCVLIEIASRSINNINF